jgi:hypothetical protein
MRTRLTNTLRRLLTVACFALLLTPVLARGDGSISFNGPTPGTSKLESTAADVLGSSSDMTICVWVYPEGLGESSDGYVVTFDETGNTGVRLQKDGSATSLTFTATFGTTAGFWSFPVAEDAWSAVAVTYNKSLATNNPAARVNFSSATVTQSGPDPTGAVPTINSGYCIGARSNQNNTWEGRIAHVQVFNRILSADEMDACLRAPGSVTKDLRLWLPMTNGIDIHDRSGYGSHGTATDLATGDNGPVLARPLGASPRGVAYVDSGYNSVNQFVLPRRGDGTGHPALQVKGSGPASVIQGTTYGPAEGTVDPQEIVVTQDYTSTTMDYWTNGSLATDPVLQPEIRDCTIVGKDDVGNYTSGGKVNDQPGLYNPASSHRDLETGLYIQSSGPLVENVRFFHIAGTCCYAKQPAGLLNQGGAFQPFDREKPTFQNLWFLRAYRGIEIDQVDAVVGNITCLAMRDFGIKFTAGSAQIDGAMHFWGVSSSPGTSGAAPAPAVWFDDTAGACWGGPWYPETSDIGILIESGTNRLNNIYTKDCAYGNIKIMGPKNVLSSFECNILNGTTETNAAQGILIAAQETTLRDGWFGDDDPLPGYPVPNGEIAIRVLGTNSGERMTLENLVFFGTGTSTVPMISVEEPLNRSTIAVKAFNSTNGGTLLDLYTGNNDRLGVGNYISVETSNVATPVKLDPTGWDDWNNTIVVNGVVQTSPTVTLTISAGGAITLTQRNHVVDTFGAAATDDLDTINGGVTGRTIVLRAANTNRTVVLRDGVGNLKLESNFSLDNTEDTITLYHDGTNWLEKARRDNGT